MQERKERQKEAQYMSQAQQMDVQQTRSMGMQQTGNDPIQAKNLCRQKIQEFAKRSGDKRKTAEILKEELGRLEQELQELHENANQYEIDQLNKEVRTLSRRYTLVQNEVKLQQEQAQEWEDAQNALAAKWNITDRQQEESKDDQSGTEAAQQRLEEIENEVEMEESLHTIKKQYDAQAKEKSEASRTVEQHMSKMQEIQAAYKSRRGYFDSDYFKNVGAALEKYLTAYGKENHEQECAVAEKELRDAANAYLQHAARSKQNGERIKRQTLLKDMLNAIEQQNMAVHILQQEDNASITSEKQRYKEDYEKKQESEKKRQEREQQEKADREYVEQELQREYQEEAEPQSLTPSEQIREAVIKGFQSKEFNPANNIDMDLYLKEGILYDKAGERGILYSAIESHSEWFNMESDAFPQEISLGEDGEIHTTLGAGANLAFALFQNETDIEAGNDNLGIETQVVASLLATKYEIAAKIGDLGEEGYGVGVFAGAGVNLAELEIATSIKLIGMRLNLVLGLSVGAGVSAGLVMSGRKMEFQAEIAAILGSYFDISIEYGEEITPELVQTFFDSYQENLRAGEKELQKVREEQEMEEEDIIKNATEQDRKWWQAAGKMDYECMCGMEVLRRELAKGESADQAKINGILLIMRERLKDKYNSCKEQLKVKELDEKQKEYFRTESDYIRMVYEILSDTDVLQNLKNGESIQKLNELETNVVLPEDLHIDMTGVMKAIRDKMEPIKELNLGSGEMLKWQNNQMSVKSEEEAEKIKEGICSNVSKLPLYKEYKFINEWNMKPDTESVDKECERISKNGVDLEQLVQLVVDKYAGNVNEELNSLYALSEYPVDLLLQIDRLRHQYRHMDIYNDSTYEQKFKVAGKLVQACVKLNMTMDNLERSAVGYKRELLEKREEEHKTREEKAVEQQKRKEVLTDSERSDLIRKLQLMGNNDIALILHTVEEMRMGNQNEEISKELCKKLIHDMDAKASALRMSTSFKRFTSFNVHDEEFLDRQVGAYSRIVEIIRKYEKNGMNENTIRELVDSLENVPVMPVKIQTETKDMKKQMREVIRNVEHKADKDILINRHSYELFKKYLMNEKLNLNDEKECAKLSKQMSQFFYEMPGTEEYQDGWLSDGKAAVLLKQIQKQADEVVAQEQKQEVKPLKTEDVQTVFALYGSQLTQKNDTIAKIFLRPDVTERMVRLQNLVNVYNELPNQQFSDSLSTLEGERYANAREIRDLATWLTTYMDQVILRKDEIKKAAKN